MKGCHSKLMTQSVESSHSSFKLGYSKVVFLQ